MKSKVLGITGSFKSGKTTTARMFKRLGAACIDADRIYHQLLRTDAAIDKRIVSAFGEKVLNNNGKIDRKKLAKLVFGKKTALKRLTGITHPVIIKKMKSRLAELKKANQPLIVIDAPLLVEVGLVKLVDRLVVVKAKRRHLINRAEKLGTSKTETIKRLSSQLPCSAKIKLADLVIDNNGSLKQTEKQVKNICRAISYKL